MEWKIAKTNVWRRYSHVWRKSRTYFPTSLCEALAFDSVSRSSSSPPPPPPFPSHYLCHIQLCHRSSFTHTTLLHHHFVTHHFVTHTHHLSHTHNFVTQDAWTCWRNLFVDPQLVGIACGSVRTVVWRIWHKLQLTSSTYAHVPRFCYCLMYPVLSWNSITTGDSTPAWILDVVKLQASTVSVWHRANHGWRRR